MTRKVSLNEASMMLGCSRMALTNALDKKVHAPLVWAGKLRLAAKSHGGKLFRLGDADKLLDRKVFLLAVEEALGVEISRNLGRGRPGSRVSEISLQQLPDGEGFKIDCLEPSCLMSMTENRISNPSWESLASTASRLLARWRRAHGLKCRKKY